VFTTPSHTGNKKGFILEEKLHIKWDPETNCINIFDVKGTVHTKMKAVPLFTHVVLVSFFRETQTEIFSKYLSFHFLCMKCGW